jgi:thiamine biosynthesis lipoprotein
MSMSSRNPTRRDFFSVRPPSLAETSGGTGDVASNAPPAGADAGEQLLHHLATSAMGCRFEIYFDPSRFPQAPGLAWDALDRVHQLDQMLSTYREDSAISEVNRAAALAPVTAPSELVELVELALRLHAETGGAFDITSGPLSKVWGFYHRRPQVPESKRLQAALQVVGSQYVELDAHRRIGYRKPGVELNLASIGKGYALDQCRSLLQTSGVVTDYLIHGGQSSVLAVGESQPGSGGWPIGVVHPIWPTQRLGLVTLRDQSLATSGNQRQSLVHRGRRLGHVIDPRTGWPSTEILSATVIADSATLTDALATAFCVMSLDAIRQYCCEHPGVSAIIVRSNSDQPSEIVVDFFNLTGDQRPVDGDAEPWNRLDPDA